MQAKAAALNIQGYHPPAPQAEEEYQVRGDCWEAAHMFFRLVCVPENGPIGSVDLQWMFRLYEVSEPRQMLEDLRIMERAWLQAEQEAV